MAFATKSLAAVAFLAFLPLGACATETAGGYGGAVAQGYPGAAGYGGGALAAEPHFALPESHDGLLTSPPNNARAGECYAKVVVPGHPIGAPPAQQRAVWVQTPPGPGQVSPTWCIYYLPGAPQPVAMSPERFGWIRVVCDKDATEDKIRHVQRRLHEWGDYDGSYDGHFDHATADGVARFQEQRHIEHGGYLSVKTVEDLDGAPPQGVLTPAFDEGHPNLNAASLYASSVYRAEAYPPTVQTSVAPCGQVACGAPPPIAYAPPPPQVIYAPPPPPQIIYRASPPQVVVQKVIQPVYQQIYAQAPQPPCGQPACAPQPQPYPCGGPTCASGGQGWGGQGWGGGYGQQGPTPYRALLTWSGKTTY